MNCRGMITVRGLSPYRDDASPEDRPLSGSGLSASSPAIR
jgi:hypothetical protein